MGELIYGVIGALTVLVGAMVWYLKYQTKRQAEREDKHDKVQGEERLFYRNLITNDMKSLHADSVKSAELNTKSLALQKDIMKQLDEHDGHSREAWNKTNESLSAICDKLNNKNPKKVGKK